MTNQGLLSPKSSKELPSESVVLKKTVERAVRTRHSLLSSSEDMPRNEIQQRPLKMSGSCGDLGGTW